MNLKMILSCVLDELNLVDAFDGEGDRFGSDTQGRGGWLEAHDRRFHGGHFDPETQTCGLRDKMQSADNADYIPVRNEQGTIRQIPLKSEFSDLLGRAYSEGLLSEQDGAAIDAMYQEVSAWMDSADENAEVPQNIKDSMRGLADIENGLSAAMADTPTQASAGGAARMEDGELFRAYNRACGHDVDEHETGPFSANLANLNSMINGVRTHMSNPDLTAEQAELGLELLHRMEQRKSQLESRRVPPIQRLVRGYQDRLANSFPPGWQNWNAQIQRAVGAGDTAACVRELLEHPENPRYRELLDAYTRYGVERPTSWAARLMGTIERTHPDWRGQQNQESNNNNTTTIDESNFICKDRPNSTRYNDLIFRPNFGLFGIDPMDVVRDAADEFRIGGASNTQQEYMATSRAMWAADDAEAADGLADYNRRKSVGQTTPLEDKFHRLGLHAAPHLIPPVTRKQRGYTCYACHAVSAIRALFNIPVRPHGLDIHRTVAGKIWAQVRTSAFPGAIGLIDRTVAQRECENAPVGSVIMNTDSVHCFSFQKTERGWRILETYNGEVSSLFGTICDNISYPDERCLSKLRPENANAMAVLRRRAGALNPDVTNEAIVCGRSGAILITPEIAKKCKPEYLIGALTGTPYDDGQSFDL